MSVCPAAVVRAPVERVWRLLTEQPDLWWDATTERAEPLGPAQAGQALYLSSRALGRKWQVTMQVAAVDPEGHRLRLQTHLPLGLAIDNVVTATAIDAGTCRVQYG